MPIFNTAVILWSWGVPVSLRDKSWYEQYFFNQFHGHAAYWLNQSKGDLLIDGQVFDWVFDASPERDFSNRKGVAELAMGHLESANDIDFSGFEGIVVVLGVPKSKNVNGGSTGAKSRSRSHNAVITRLDDPFDFICHELGHAIGLQHSFTWNTAFNVIGEKPGGYGHPHCIMSAMAYGGFGEAHHDAMQPLGSIDEYRDVGPSVNGVTALSRGWIDAVNVNLLPGFSGEFEVRARQWLGQDPALPPQALHLMSPDGSTRVVEFYESRDYDRGLHANRLIITQDSGGLADQHYPGKHSGTYLSSVALPAALAGPAAVINVPGPIGLIPLFYDPVRHVLKVRVLAKVASGGVIAMSSSLSAETATVGSGSVTFNPGDRFCVTGTWTFDIVERRETCVIEASHPRFHPGSSVSWTIDGLPCTSSPLTIRKTVSVADAKRLDITKKIDVKVAFTIEATPTGSRLTLRNRPEDESYNLRVEASFKTSVAASTAGDDIRFSGRDIQFPPKFTERYVECHKAFIRKKLQDTKFKVVFDPTKIHDIPPPLREEIHGWLGGLADRLDAGDRAGYETAAAALRHHIGLPDAKLIFFEPRDTVRFEALLEDVTAPAHEWRQGLTEEHGEHEG